ncbi:hypothetical protein LSAT2_006013 [Lamellibrachia satsuma]|nr:hypothetical protein LSAT2_006013 [Lamellibrachia satsuma]
MRNWQDTCGPFCNAETKETTAALTRRDTPLANSSLLSTALQRSRGLPNIGQKNERMLYPQHQAVLSDVLICLGKKRKVITYLYLIKRTPTQNGMVGNNETTPLRTHEGERESGRVTIAAFIPQRLRTSDSDILRYTSRALPRSRSAESLHTGHIRECAVLTSSEKMASYSNVANEGQDVLNAYKKKFDAFDLNRNGIISMREFAAVSMRSGFKMSKEDIIEIFEKPDMEQTGINFEEFVDIMQRKAGRSRALAPYRDKFRRYDFRRNGCITIDEALPVLSKELGFDRSKTEAFIEIYDKNKDGEITLLEFVDFEKKVENLRVQIKAAFEAIDKNKDGFIDPDEAKDVLLPKGYSEQQVEDRFGQFDRDRDGLLNYQEFAAFYDIPLN